MDTNKNKDCVYVCLYQTGGEEKITVFDNADAMLDWEDCIRSAGGTIRWSNKLEVYTGVAGYPSGETEK